MKKADIILIVGCLFAAFLLGLFLMLYRRTGSTIRISHDGIGLYTIDLDDIDSERQTQYYLIRYEDSGQDIHIMHFEQYPEIPAGQRYNLFSVTDGIVTMEAADCRDQICVRHKPIRADRESIICLPNRLVIEMSGSTVSGAAQPDAQERDGMLEDGADEPLDGVTG
ncbi:MAG: NusG domain II-containing protein [Eubacterium sp.]|nr:NusG domain II-containing protein [Eubacterium sp.]